MYCHYNEYGTVTKIYGDTEAQGHRELALIGVLPGFPGGEGRARPDCYCHERLEKHLTLLSL